ncbi:MAG: NTPase [Candidatus Thermoplasmatota archaeon]|nr:NTPase [Candidatus Thermoplasmatota archaeon]
MAEIVRIGITGLPSSGKTATVLKIVESLKKEKYVVGGFVTPEIVEGGKRTGFKIIDLMTKEEGTLAHLKTKSRTKIGAYGVEKEILENLGVNAIKNAMEEADIIIIDEMAKMEMSSDLFCDTVRALLETDLPIIMTIHRKSRHPILQEIRRRTDIRMMEVTPINKALMPYKIEKILRGRIQRRERE